MDREKEKLGEFTNAKNIMFWLAASLMYLSCLIIVLWLNRAPISFDFSAVEKPGTIDFFNGDINVAHIKLVKQWFGMRFKVAGVPSSSSLTVSVEKLWREQTLHRDLTSGAVSLMAVILLIILGQVMNIFWMQLKSGCDGIESGYAWARGLLHMLFLGGCLGAAALCYCKPVANLYWLIVFGMYFYIPASALEPFSYSCRALQECGSKNEVCPEQERGGDGPGGISFTKMGAFYQSYRHADCGLIGMTSVHTLITWILFQPWVLWRFHQIFSIFIWIGIVCYGWVYLHDTIFEEEVFATTEKLYFVGLLCMSVIVAARSFYRVEKFKRAKFLEDIGQRDVGIQLFAQLEYMMPAHVIQPMLLAEVSAERDSKGKDDGDTVIATPYRMVSVLFIIIADFDKAARVKQPKELLKYLNDLFTLFDRICLARRVTKIETVGEEYVACVGVIPEDDKEFDASGHTPLLERLIDAADAILRHQSEDAHFKMGIHTGPITAGVIGSKLPRYRLFGDTMNTAARMMQKSAVATLQFGKDTYGNLPQELQERCKFRGEVEMKGKGKVDVYTYSCWAEVPRDDLAKATKSMRYIGRAVGSKPVRRRAGRKATDHSALSMSSAKSHIFERDRRASSSSPRLAGRAPVNPRDEGGITAEAKAFDEAMQKITEKHATLSERHPILSQKQGFTDQMTEDWLIQFHAEKVAHKAHRRFAQSTIMLMFVSGSEIVFMHSSEIWIYPHSLYAADKRLIVFCISRFAPILITMLWWYIAEATKWLETEGGRPKLARIALTLYICLTVVSVQMSYDALMFSDQPRYQNLMLTKDMQKVFCPPSDVWFTCNFLLFQHVTMRMHTLLFWHAFCFLGLTLWWICLHEMYNNLYRAEKSDQWNNAIPPQVQFFLFAQTCMNVAVAHADEQFSRARFKGQHAVRNMENRMEGLWNSLMPPLVVDEIRCLGPDADLPTHHYRHATIAQSDLCGFTKLASDKEPSEVVKLVSELFGLFDLLTDSGVCKVETIGDAYIAGMAERPLTLHNSPVTVISFGLDMIRCVQNWSRKRKLKVQCRVGIHYGECIGGIVGNDMQRYHLFGGFMTSLEVLEATSEPELVQVSKACMEEVERQLRSDPEAASEKISFRRRRDAFLETSKGERHDYSEVGGVTYFVEGDKGMPDYDDPARRGSRKDSGRKDSVSPPLSP